MKRIIIYTDGACSGNPGPGGWGFIVLADGKAFEGSGGDVLTTNNRMELLAVINALEHALSKAESDEFADAEFEVRTDSQYVKNGVTAWMKKWKQNGWKTTDKKPVKNRDLWERLDILAIKLHARFTWVEGHAGEPMNERCDELARSGIPSARQ